jgi:plasmid stability protein
MSSLTIHNLDNAIKDQLAINAKKHNRSIDEEVQQILKQALFPSDKQKNWVVACTSKLWDLLAARI